jgi:hypothetical protein
MIVPLAVRSASTWSFPTGRKRTIFDLELPAGRAEVQHLISRQRGRRRRAFHPSIRPTFRVFRQDLLLPSLAARRPLVNQRVSAGFIEYRARYRKKLIVNRSNRVPGTPAQRGVLHANIVLSRWQFSIGRLLDCATLERCDRYRGKPDHDRGRNHTREVRDRGLV